MIEGTVNENLEVTVPLVLLNDSREEHVTEAIIDTGFTGDLTLPRELIQHLALSWQSRGHALLADGSLYVFDSYIGTLLWNS